MGDALENWGFATEFASMGLKHVRVHVSAAQAQSLAASYALPDQIVPALSGANFSLSETAKNEEARHFVGYLRLLVEGGQGFQEKVNCGGHEAPKCASCPQGHGASWCNGDCQWVNMACVQISAHSSARQSHQRSTWEVESRAMLIGKELIRSALSRYPQTLHEDESLLDQGIPD